MSTEYYDQLTSVTRPVLVLIFHFRKELGDDGVIYVLSLAVRLNPIPVSVERQSMNLRLGILNTLPACCSKLSFRS